MYRIYWESRGKLVSVRLNNLEWAREVAKNHDGRVEREYTVEDAEREIEEAIKNGDGGIYSFIQDLKRGGDITKEEAFNLMCKYVNGIPTYYQ